MKAPDGVKNLYLDLRDKRLLPIVILLVVALIAIPFLVGGETEPIVPSDGAVSSAAASDADSVAQLTPFVTNDVPGIREFDERLDSFQKRNPFKQQLTGPTKAQQEALAKAESKVKTTEAAASGGSTGGSTSTSTDTTTSTSGDTDSTSTDTTTPSDEVILYTLEIDVKVGRVGDSKKVKNVKSLQYLPGKKRPVVQYVQSSFDRSSASFVVSRSVDSSEGEGTCDPNPFNCQFLLLEVGQEQRFTYDDGKTYRLKLLAVNLKKERVDPDEVASKERSAGADGYERLAESIRG